MAMFIEKIQILVIFLSFNRRQGSFDEAMMRYRRLFYRYDVAMMWWESGICRSISINFKGDNDLPYIKNKHADKTIIP
jgi:hypothetical protein